MGYVKEKVSYLKGLAAGMKIDETTNEGKLFKEIIKVLEDIADSVSDMEESQEHLEEQVDAVDEDLGIVERLLYDELFYDGHGYGDEDDKLIAEIQCPHCNEIVELTEKMLDDEMDSFKCSVCGKDITVEWDCDCEECNDEIDEV